MYDPENELGIPKQSWLKFKISVLWNCGYFYRGFSFLLFCLFIYLFICLGFLVSWLGFVCLGGLEFFFFVGWVLGYFYFLF